MTLSLTYLKKPGLKCTRAKLHVFLMSGFGYHIELKINGSPYLAPSGYSSHDVFCMRGYILLGPSLTNTTKKLMTSGTPSWAYAFANTSVYKSREIPWYVPHAPASNKISGKYRAMASSSHNRQNTAVRGGMGLTKTPANTASDPDSSFLYGTKAGLHDTHDQNVFLLCPPLW